MSPIDNYTNIIWIAVDADSLVYKACYRHQNEIGVDLELAYAEFCFELGKIRSKVFKMVPFTKGDKVKAKIVLSPKRSFRHDIYPEYKGNRKKVEMIHGIKALKLLIMHRFDDAEVHKNIEADDVVIWYSNHENMFISAIDKDVINASATACYNYNTRKWTNGHLSYEVEKWYAKQALMGDSVDNIKGAPNMGEERSQQWVEKFQGDFYSWSEFSDLFGGEELAEQSMNLVRMDGLHKIDGKMAWKPWSIEESSYWEY